MALRLSSVRLQGLFALNQLEADGVTDADGVVRRCGGKADAARLLSPGAFLNGSAMI